MPRFSRLDVLNRVIDVGLVPIFTHSDPAVACKVVEACAAGGASVFEFTNRGDHAIDVFQAIEAHCRRSLPHLILGVGSIVDEATAALFVARGANYVVSPSFNPRVAEFCNRRKVPYMPGCMTVTEIGNAEASGVEIVKVFPCDAAGGPGFLKAILGPSPWTRVLPTGIEDATRESMVEWIQAGACALGLGRALFDKKAIETGDFAVVQARAKEILGWIQEARARAGKGQSK
ncbi:MAG: bifunctional 4-hydroxy-2-oxoglutarate aldolase/2-dehydro-3-deoxy-phosphogluconate aldolase [Verrucomicrobia bacterium]|nr:bifunctional 4-hydroxy-2-oxoglutarate aldolase/2-dehydro-3-deoxy-phosphogluconate aldolase [Verrucomicrobiota bacterium]MBI3868498.1 bifunctional 4-hydroxy-2-oxoglutarate aldolase/2-dehydro-3-deoxy-phosphogluconate aldolase [Verrucomicrobiota bacterium]